MASDMSEPSVSAMLEELGKRNWRVDLEDAQLLASISAMDDELNHYTPEQRNLGRAYAALLARCRQVERDLQSANDHCAQALTTGIDWMNKYNDALRERDEARRVLTLAASWFREYKHGHISKGDVEKAERNRIREEMCEQAALARKP